MPLRFSVTSLRSLRNWKAAPEVCCAQCLAHHSAARANLRGRILALRDIRTGRPASTSATVRGDQDDIDTSPFIAPATNIDKPADVKPLNETLYAALVQLKSVAAKYVNQDRLALALKSLERKDSTIRIAVLSMDGNMVSVRRLVRLLLADPLGKEAEWERELVQKVTEDSILIRYGSDDQAILPSSQIRTLHIPSATLQKNNLEIFISSLNLKGDRLLSGRFVQAPRSILVPNIESHATAEGGLHRPYPVHKVLLLGHGLKSLCDFGRYSADLGGEGLPTEVIQVAAEAPAQTGRQSFEKDDGEAVLLDTETGEHALASIRQSINNALAWEHGWFEAGVAPLSAWLVAGTSATNSSLPPIVKQVIGTVLTDTAASISLESAAQILAQDAMVSDITRQTLLTATALWSEQAHNELRNQLDLAFASKNWARLKWYKLFWRSDDVTMLLTEIMEQRWLPEAEKGAIYLAGRIEGAGLLDSPVRGKVPDPTPTLLANDLDVLSSDMPESATGQLPIDSYTYSMHIPKAREVLASRTIPALQALSQKLVLETGSATAITTAFTAMAYIGFANATLFEAGAVFAFGVVISLKRLQNKWEAAREYWEREVREEGRVALKNAEQGIKTIVDTGGVGTIDEHATEERSKAEAAVAAAKEALDRIK